MRGVGSRRPRQTEGSLTDYNEDCVFIMRVMLAVLTLPCAAAASGRRLLSGPAAEPHTPSTHLALHMRPRSLALRVRA